MQKRTFVVLLALLAVFSLSLSVPAPASAESVTLTYSNFFPPTHVMSQLPEAWCKEVEKRTEGRVKVQYFPGQTLTKADQVYDGVVQGLSDVGLSVLAYTKGRFPVMMAIDLPLGYPSAQAATRVANELYEKFKPAEFNDTQVMYFSAHGPGLVSTKGKPVKTLDELKGLKIKATGMSALVVKALGATPVPMSMPDTYQSLQKGVVDGAAAPFESYKGWKLGEVTKYITADYSAAYTTNFFVVMNKKKWDAISPQDQKAIEAINKEWIKKTGEAWDAIDVEGIRFFLNQGNEIVGLDAKEAAKWADAVAPVVNDYVKDLDSKGIKGKEVIDFIKAGIKE